MIFPFFIFLFGVEGQKCPREWGKAWRKKILKLVNAADHYASIKKENKVLRLHDDCIPMISNFKCFEMESPNKKTCELIVWNTPEKSYRGICDETLQITHSDCENTICPTNFFFSLDGNSIPESYPFSSLNPASKKDCKEFVFTVLRNGSEIELNDDQCNRMVEATFDAIREINSNRGENSSSEILSRRSRTLTQSFSSIPKPIPKSKPDSNPAFPTAEFINDSSQKDEMNLVDILQQRIDEKDEEIKRLQESNKNCFNSL
ncbi:Oidioi.mRNA.OKI2018_I69.PAR.g9381.t1.cds [Oikopleura dioica]|uniref:Oidioi.mRNA.OKI2018_I69.PAR.g9381.t1.cds n=1 Tax=Oikopleura dioica TaxID=34765 RepID=A0ABN7RK88_OIKDI|nr:Oidioi.mRNA.OKI2018_I69.PAR.g9381.t1.cds [Oikopleura dioica]